MNIDNIEQEFKNGQYEIDNNTLLIALLKLSVSNKVKIEAMLNELIAIRESQKGKTQSEIDDYFEEEIESFHKNLSEEIESVYALILRQILK